MQTDATGTPSGAPPTDFAEYEAWYNSGRGGENGTSADTEAEAKESKKATDSETDQAAEDKAKSDDKPQKKSGFQRRIDRLNQKLGAKDAEIAQLKAQGGNATQPKKEEAKPAAESTGTGKPESKNFETYEEYIEALSDWKIEQREAKRASEQAERERKEAQAAAIAANAETFSERKKAYPDWDEKVAAAKDIPITQLMHELIVESEFRADLGYHFASNPEDAERIAKLSPARQAVELGKLEASFEKSEKKSAEATKPRVTKAPAPAKTVRAQAEASEPDPSDFAAWEKWRNAQPGAAFRR